MHDTQNRHTIRVRAGECVSIPVFALQRDPLHFPHPERFDPERFGAERRSAIRPLTFLALGVGPRSCVAARHVLTELKVFLHALLLRARLERSEQSLVPIQLRCGGWFLRARNAFAMQMRRRPTKCTGGKDIESNRL